jgi:hypothetical protein
MSLHYDNPGVKPRSYVALTSACTAAVSIGQSVTNCNAILRFVLRNSLSVMAAIDIFNLCVHTYLAVRCFLFSRASV